MFSYFEIQTFWIIRTNSDREITKTIIIDLDEIYNIVVDGVFIWNHLWSFWIVWTISDGEMDKTKFVDLDEVYNFIVDNFLFEIIYGLKILFEDLIF